MSMRKISLLLLTVLAFCPLVISQEASSPRPGPALPPETLGPPLIAWSQLQKPHPVQQEQASRTDAGATQDSQTEPSTAQPIMGTIVKNGSRYVLKVSESAIYEIDNQDKARLYVGKRVEVTGNIDTKTNTIHVTKIEMLS